MEVSPLLCCIFSPWAWRAEWLWPPPRGGGVVGVPPAHVEGLLARACVASACPRRVFSSLVESDGLRWVVGLVVGLLEW